MSTLINKNIMVDGRRTSMRLEPEMWDALSDICRFENMKLSHICHLVNQHRRGGSLTSCMRVFIISYYKTVALSRVNLNVITPQRSEILEEALRKPTHGISSAHNIKNFQSYA